MGTLPEKKMLSATVIGGVITKLCFLLHPHTVVIHTVRVAGDLLVSRFLRPTILLSATKRALGHYIPRPDYHPPSFCSSGKRYDNFVFIIEIELDTVFTATLIKVSPSSGDNVINFFLN
jgi:hypothetical protein